MMPLATLHGLFAYNRWAWQRQLTACRTLSPEQFVQPLISSFPSVRDTLAHLLDTEIYYLHRWRGRTRDEIIAAIGWARSDERSKLWPEEFRSLSDIEARWHSVQSEVHEYLLSLKEDDLAQKVMYLDSTSKVWTFPRWQMMLHVVNHQTYHRGQLTTLLRQLGVPAPQIDLLITYHLEAGEAMPGES